MISSGKLNQRVRIEQRGSEQDALGQPVNNWQPVATVWASVRHVSGVQAIKASADTALVRASIRIRYRAGIEAGQRVVSISEGTHYTIQALLANKPAGYIDLVCEVMP